MREVWGLLAIVILCPLLGGVPVVRWSTHLLARQRLDRLGTGNISVSAAFYHGGTVAGVVAVILEAAKGILAVLLARSFFPASEPEWELVALVALVMGRYWMGRGAGTTNVTWGAIVHDPLSAGLTALIGGVSFTIIRDRVFGRNGILILYPVVLFLLHSSQIPRVLAAVTLCVLLAWIYRKMPDDLDLSATEGRDETQGVFRFFQAEKSLIPLDRPLDPQQVGQKAATLSQLRYWGYPVPTGWVLLPGDDPAPLLQSIRPSREQPFVVRSSAVGEDTERASAAGQYASILNITNSGQLLTAVVRCFESYNRPNANRYRRDRRVEDSAIAVLIQPQIRGVYSGVAFSRDPVARSGDAVVVEALPGAASRVVSGQVTPEQYRVFVGEIGIEKTDVPAFEIEGDDGNIPAEILRQVAFFARQLERRFDSIPQDIEWTFDGDRLWLLQSRPITTLYPVWTRKIAAEVIPGTIRPLTWSINRPLTCGVWGDIFRIVLSDRVGDLDFNETATLHYSRAYFNASLLGKIFRRMGLPAESLDFLVRGSSFEKPPMQSTLQNVPGLLRLLERERRLHRDFQRDVQQTIAPILEQCRKSPACHIRGDRLERLQSPLELLDRVEDILEALKVATYYSIFAPLSLAMRKAILQVADEELDNAKDPEIAALQALNELAVETRHFIPDLDPDAPTIDADDPASLFAEIAEITDGQTLLDKFDEIVDRYGYLSEVGTDIAVPTWKEDPSAARAIFARFFANPNPPTKHPRNQRPRAKLVQRRRTLKGQVTEVYSQLLAELRWSFIALERYWLDLGVLREAGDIFFLEFHELCRLVRDTDRQSTMVLPNLIRSRQERWQRDRALKSVPRITYGTPPPADVLRSQHRPAVGELRGIGASAGRAEGCVKILQSLETPSGIDRDTILVVPYTDSGWAPLLAQAGGLIAEVGGRLSHGAIVAREYGIPAVMDIDGATERLREGQRVRVDGERGIVEILD